MSQKLVLRMVGTTNLSLAIVVISGHYSPSNPMPLICFLAIVIGAIIYEGTR